MRKAPLFVVGAMQIVGCAPGHLTTDQGSVPLRTAWYAEEPTDDGVALRFFLSTSDFECELPASIDEQEQARALQEWWVSACREDAQHVFLSVYTEEVDWDQSIPTAQETLPTADAATVLIRESALHADGITPFVVDIDYQRSLGAGGTVILRHVGQGRFWWPDISGDFHAQRCEADVPTVLDAMVTSTGQPALACP